MHRLTLAAVAMAAAVGAARADEPKPLADVLTVTLAETKAPGGLVGIYRAGKPAVEVGVGFADIDAKRPMAPNCHFRIASLSKVFVAQAVLTLVDEGTVSADDPVSKYVPEVPNGDKITLRHLATHRSGLFNPIESKAVKAAFAAAPTKTWTTQDLLGFGLEREAYFPPGEKHHYSNVNTVLLAAVLEKATGQPWRDEVTARVVKPLGLTHTSIPTDNALPEPFARGYALGGKDGPFFVRGDTRHDVTGTSPSWWGAAGNMVSTLGDLGKAAKPLATGALLKEKGKKELFAWTQADQPGFEYGFHLERTDGMVGHDGDVPGYQPFMFYLPDQDAAVVAVANLYGWSVRGMPGNALAEAAIAHQFPDRKPDHRSRIEGVEKGLRPFAEAAGKPHRWVLADRMTEHGVPGVGVAVIDGGRVVWAKGYGVRDVEGKAPVDADTRFQAGSISKFAAAVVALRLADAGTLDLDRDVNDLLTDWKLPRDDKWAAVPVTPRRLLSHTAGVGVHGFVGYQRRDDLPSNRQVLTGESPANSGAVRVTAEPGTAEGYSGGGYQVLQQVLADAGGKPFADLARERVFAPLKLTRTGFDQPLPAAEANAAVAHDGGKRLAVPHLSYPELAAAGLWSTPTEIAELSLAVRAAARGEGKLLSADAARAMLTPAKLPGGKTGGHGLGPEVDGAGPTLRFGHSGGTVGFRSVFVLFAETGQGAVVMTNGSGDALMNEVLRAVAAEYRWPGDAYQTKVREAVALSAAELAGFAGKYAIEGNDTPYTVAIDGDGLRLDTRYKAPVRLLPAGGDRFFGTSHDREVRFERGGDNRVTAATVTLDGRTLFRLKRRD